MAFDSTMVQCPVMVNVDAANPSGGTQLNQVIVPNVATPAGQQGVNSLTLNTGGSGYNNTPVTVNFTGGGSGATANAFVGFPIASVNVTQPGVYQTKPTIGATGGTGAAFTLTMQAVGAVMVGPGTGYIAGNGLGVLGGSATQGAQLIVSHTTVVSLTVAGGTGYQVGDSIKLAGGTAVYPCIITVTSIGSGGSITGFQLTNGGTYIVEAFTFTQGSTSGAGSGATFTSVSYGVLDVTIYAPSPGSYTILPTNPVSVNGGSGTGATFNVDWGLLGIGVSGGGSGYDSNSTITVTGGSGVGGLATINLAATGSIKGLELVSPGVYTSTPTVSFSQTGFSGTAATATATIGSTGTNVTVPIALKLPSTNYTVKASANQPCTTSYTNKTTSGFTLVLTPPSGTAISAGTADVIIDFTQ